jgi:CheY-like chemotaxis protein
MNKNFGSILVVDDDEDVLLAARLFLKQHAVQVHTEKNPQMLPSLMKNERYDVILLDMNFARDVSSGSEGFHWLNTILDIDPSAVVVLITAYGDVEMAVRAIKGWRWIISGRDRSNSVPTLTNAFMDLSAFAQRCRAWLPQFKKLLRPMLTSSFWEKTEQEKN